MKIIYVTSQPPNYGGGGIAVFQSLFSLSKNYDITYIGPNYENKQLKIKKENYIFLKKTNNIIKLLMQLFFKFQISHYYLSWKKIEKKIDWDKYDIVFLEFSKFVFVAKAAKKYNKKLIVRIHNVEKDYAKNLLKVNFNLENILIYFFRAIHEKRIVKLADKLIVLTRNDKKGIIESYKLNEAEKDKIEIIPICVLNKITLKSLTQKIEKKIKKNLLITATLCRGPNYYGIKWFIKNIWTNILQDYTLTIAGAYPNNELIKLCEKKDINLISNPENMKFYFLNAFLYIAPIFFGTGMKVKIAEALSFGLPILGTSHSFIGYNIKNGINGFVTNDKKDFIDILQFMNTLPYKKYINLRKKIYRFYISNYSLDSSKKEFKRILDSIFA